MNESAGERIGGSNALCVYTVCGMRKACGALCEEVSTTGGVWLYTGVRCGVLFAAYPLCEATE